MTRALCATVSTVSAFLILSSPVHGWLPSPARGQATAAPAAMPTGIYLENASGKPLRLHVTTADDMKAKGMGKSMLTGGLSKPQMVGSLSGASAKLRVTADATFRLQFDDQSVSKGRHQASPKTPEEAMAMFGDRDEDAMPAAQNLKPDYFALLHLTVADAQRQAQMPMSPGSKTKDSVAVTIEPIEAHAFRVRPKTPLTPGEYAFAFVTSGQLWDFGVDGPK